jgi:GTP-binding protein
MVHHAQHPQTGRPYQGRNLTTQPALTHPALTEDEIAAGAALFARPATFFHAAQALDHLPPQATPEIAFAGRSNVGKSSLLNALTGRRALARASNTPGRTRQLNFFDLGGLLTLVDMPGYGYAKASREIKKDWQGLMFDYLRGRPNLVRVVLLLDSRIELKPHDTEVMDLLDRAAVTFMLVLTKTDGASPAALAAKRAEAEALTKTHPAAYPTIAMTSSETGAGIDDLRAELARLVSGE